MLTLTVPAASATDGFWATAGGGSWATAANWDGGDIANGAEDTAYFGLFADIPANTVVTLDGARTIGHLVFTDSSGADGVTLNPGAGGPLTLVATLDTPSLTVIPLAQTVTVNVPLAGTNGLEKIGSGTLVLSATNIYTGETLVSGGTLLANGRFASEAVTVAVGGRLGGTGVVSAPVVVQSGGTLAPGNPLGTLSLSNSLGLQPGSLARVEVNAATTGYDFVQGMTSVNYDGSLVVCNLAGTPALGQSFQLFSAASASGNFTNLTPQLGGGLRWRFLPASGVLSVVSSASQPVIASYALAGGVISLEVTNGPPGATAYLLGSTNVALSVTNWTRLATNVFDVSGERRFTNAMTSTPQRFYRVSYTATP